MLFSPGKGLFSAIVLTKPDHVVVITSEQAAANIPLVVEQAKQYHTNFTLEYHTVVDPFTGFHQGRKLAKRLTRKAGNENIANLVGGTTALQDAVKCLSDLTGDREVAVIDRHPIEEQRANPFLCQGRGT